MLTLVLPAFNEERDLPRLLERIQGALGLDRRPWRVIVVDDGSSDGTADVVLRYAGFMPIQLVSHERNQGLAAALATGIRAALEDSQTIVTLDADDTHDPALIPLMVNRLVTGLDVVIASRFAPGGAEIGVPRHRWALSRAAGMTLGILAPVGGVRDYACGYRAYRADILHRVIDAFGADAFMSDVGFACMVELLLKVSEVGARVGEAPLVLRYDRKAGASKMPIFRTAAYYSSVLFAHRKRRLERRFEVLVPASERSVAVTGTSRAIGAVGLALTLPVMLVLGVTLRVFTRGPILIRERRVGPDRRGGGSTEIIDCRREIDLGGPPFEALRFRLPETEGPAGLAVQAVRALKLDQLPRLANVARGDTHTLRGTRRIRTPRPADSAPSPSSGHATGERPEGHHGSDPVEPVQRRPEEG